MLMHGSGLAVEGAIPSPTILKEPIERELCQWAQFTPPGFSRTCRSVSALGHGPNWAKSTWQSMHDL